MHNPWPNCSRFVAINIDLLWKIQHMWYYFLSETSWKLFFMKSYTFYSFLFSSCLFVIFGLFSIHVTHAISYQKIAPGETVTLGEFVFDDNFVATTTDCWIGITNPLNAVVIASTTPMTVNNNGWHYYNYATATSAPSGVWPSVMICGSVARGDLVMVDKSFIVEEKGEGWDITFSDFGETTVNTAYRAKLQVLSRATVPTDADSLPTITITDPVGTVKVSGAAMTRDSSGTYSYSYSITGSEIGGVWETVVSVIVNDETVKRNDYWSLSSSPADVQIVEITDRTIPTITANVRIDNMGTSASDFYYIYCIVNSADNLCGGDDDIDSGSDTAYINDGSFINLSLTLDEIPTVGTYWFKVKARALAETNWAASTEQFIAENPPITPPAGPRSGGGGGSGAPTPTNPTTSCSGADFNTDSKVNSVDFSILLAFWQKQPPFKNPCVDINKDNKVNSVDFSILLYQWKK